MQQHEYNLWLYEIDLSKTPDVPCDIEDRMLNPAEQMAARQIKIRNLVYKFCALNQRDLRCDPRIPVDLDLIAVEQDEETAFATSLYVEEGDNILLPDINVCVDPNGKITGTNDSRIINCLTPDWVRIDQQVQTVTSPQGRVSSVIKTACIELFRSKSDYVLRAKHPRRHPETQQ